MYKYVPTVSTCYLTFIQEVREKNVFQNSTGKYLINPFHPQQNQKNGPPPACNGWAGSLCVWTLEKYIYRVENYKIT